MAYVVPSGIIQLFRNINLDNRYMHTIYFANEAAQNTWFTNKIAYNYPAQMYTRHNNNIIKLKVKCDVVADCTYLRFQNSVGGKWYYAFITATNYLNENTTEIIFEIDVVQTWFIQGGSLLPCYIERQHATDDTFGINLEAEPIGSDAYDMTEIEVEGVDSDFDSYQVVINTTREPTGTAAMIKDGIVNGTDYDYIGVTSGGMAILKNKMIQALGSWDKNEQKADIVDMYMFPTNFTIGAEGEYHSTRYQVYHTGRFDNYTPKNKKLFAYPYSQLYVTTCDSDNASYRWEYFDGDITSGISPAAFDVNATMTGGGLIEMHPVSYNGITDNFDAKVVMNNFPKCSWNYDAYQAWIANGGQYKAKYDMNMLQKKGALAIAQGGVSAVSDLLGQGASMASYRAPKKLGMPAGKPASEAIQAVSTGVSAMMSIEETSLSYTEARDKVAFEFKDARYEPNIIVGQQVPNISVGYRYLRFRFFNLHVRDDEAKRIDDFFSVYGYAVNKVAVPNLNNRKHWNFIKTKNAQISGNMPASSKAALARIFDGGIFFWRNGDEVGNFNVETSHGSVDNPIL